MATTPPPPRLSLSQTAYARIKQKIVSLELAPGALIDESSLRAELNLGRTPIREALQRLAQEKLVVIVPRRGMFVSEIGITDLQRLFEVRIELEGLAAALAARRGEPEHWAQMAAALAPLEVASIVKVEALIEIDRRCHEIMYQAADNEFLQDTLVTLYALSLRLWYFSLAKIGNMREAVLEHRAILQALQAGNADLSAVLIRRHIDMFQREIQGMLLGDQPE